MMPNGVESAGMIRRIEAQNYRGLRYVSQEVGPFEVLVGPNAAGKSTFLDVIALISDFIRDGLDVSLLGDAKEDGGRARRLQELIFNQESDRFELALDIALPDRLVRLNDTSGAPYRYDLARYYLAVSTTPDGELDVQGETLWLIDGRYKQNESPTIPRMLSVPAGALRMGSTVYTDLYQPVGWMTVTTIDIEDRGSAHYFAETQRWNQVTRIGVRRSALWALPEDPERFPIAIWVRNLLRDSVRRLALNSAAMRRPVSPSAPREFSVEGANLPLVLDDLERQHAASYRDWLAHIQTILPDIARIQVHERPEDRYRYLAITYTGSNTSIPSWLVSDGTLRLLALTLLPYLPDEPVVYLIEEPENGLHPKAIEGVFQSLSSVYRGQVLVATHSPIFMGLAESNQLLCFAKTPSGAVDVVRGDQHPALADWHGQVDLPTLYAAGVLG